MSKKDKSKDTDKIKFFKLNTEGGIASSRTGTGVEEGPEAQSRIEPRPADTRLPEGTASIHEPQLDLPVAENSIHFVEIEDPPELKVELEELKASAPPPEEEQRSQEIDLLRPQVETISEKASESVLSDDQVDTLRRYISLKETEVRDLREQHRHYTNFARQVSTQMEKYRTQNKALLTELDSQRRHMESLKREIHSLKVRHDNEAQLVRNDYEEKLRRAGNYEAELKDLNIRREEWKERVKEDLKKIKLKEKELENKYELLKRDSQALLDSKDQHLLELKKKTDAFELEMESLEDRLRQTNSVLAEVESRKKRLLETLRLATSLIEGIDAEPNDLKKTG